MKFLLPLVVLLSGCATETYLLKKENLLPYKESSQVTKLNEQNLVLELSEIRDMSSGKSIGFAHTGVQYKKTPILVEGSLAQMVSKYFTHALSERNIQVVPKADVKLSINIKKFKVYEVIEKLQPERARCELDFAFDLESLHRKWSGAYTVGFLSAGDLSDGTERIEPTLASCMNDLVEKLVADEKFLEVLRPRSN